MTEDERQKGQPAFRNEAFQPAPNTPRPNGRTKLTGRSKALWIACFNIGIVQNRDDAALLDFVNRQTGIDHVRFLKFGDDAQKAIEALKGWMARESGVLPIEAVEAQYKPLETEGDRVAAELAQMPTAAVQEFHVHAAIQYRKAVEDLAARLYELDPRADAGALVEVQSLFDSVIVHDRKDGALKWR